MVLVAPLCIWFIYPTVIIHWLLNSLDVWKKYHHTDIPTDAALFQQSQLLRLRDPDPADFEVFKEWIDRETVNSTGLSPPGQWGGDNEKDLLTLWSRHEGKDTFTRWVFTSVVPWYHQRWGNNNTVCSSIMISYCLFALVI